MIYIFNIPLYLYYSTNVFRAILFTPFDNKGFICYYIQKWKLINFGILVTIIKTVEKAVSKDSIEWICFHKCIIITHKKYGFVDQLIVVFPFSIVNFPLDRYYWRSFSSWVMFDLVCLVIVNFMLFLAFYLYNFKPSFTPYLFDGYTFVVS